MKKIVCAFFVLAGLLLGACGSIFEQEPVGTGNSGAFFNSKQAQGDFFNSE